jgi:hypothetical protein
MTEKQNKPLRLYGLVGCRKLPFAPGPLGTSPVGSPIG